MGAQPATSSLHWFSIDGSRLTTVDGARDEIFVIDTHRLTVAHVEGMTQPQSVLARLAGWLGLLPSVTEAKEFEGVLEWRSN